MKNINISVGWDWKCFSIGVDTVKNDSYRYFWVFFGFLDICIYFKISNKKFKNKSKKFKITAKPAENRICSKMEISFVLSLD